MEKTNSQKHGVSKTQQHGLRTELFTELICDLYLKGFTFKQLVAYFKQEKKKNFTVEKIELIINDAVLTWNAKKDDMVENISGIELAKINRLELQYQQGYDRSCIKIKTVKQKAIPLEKGEPKQKKQRNQEPAPAGYKIIEQVIEYRQQNGDVKFLQGVQSCIEKRLEIIGHSGAKKASLVRSDELEEDQQTSEAPQQQRTIRLLVNGSDE